MMVLLFGVLLCVTAPLWLIFLAVQFAWRLAEVFTELLLIYTR